MSDKNIIQHDGAWWFIDETEDLVGPYDSYDTADAALTDYCREILGIER